MKLYNPEKFLISIHIPKTAGTSFLLVLEEWFNEKLHKHYFKEREGVMPDKLDFKNSNTTQQGVCIHGHFNKNRGFGVKDYYPEAEQFIAVIRDPLELHLSCYFYNQKLSKNDNWYRNGKKMKEKQLEIDEYLRTTKSFILNFLPWELTLDNFQEIISSNFVHLGIAEDMQKTVDIISEKLNKPKIEVPITNVSPRTNQPSQSAIEDFRSRHELEYAIYNYAVELNK
jgi:hypothetical protein